MGCDATSNFGSDFQNDFEDLPNLPQKISNTEQGAVVLDSPRGKKRKVMEPVQVKFFFNLQR
jgi:hypothetical protein